MSVKTFFLGPLWAGWNDFMKMFDFAKVFAKIGCPYSRGLYGLGFGRVIDLNMYLYVQYALTRTRAEIYFILIEKTKKQKTKETKCKYEHCAITALSRGRWLRRHHVSMVIDYADTTMTTRTTIWLETLENKGFKGKKSCVQSQWLRVEMHIAQYTYTFCTLHIPCFAHSVLCNPVSLREKVFC